MKTLNEGQTESITGGVSMIFGWALGHALDYAIEGMAEHAYEFSERDHSASNNYFLTHRERFNPMY